MLLEVFLILTTLQAQETNARFRDRSIIGGAYRSLGSVTTFPRLLPPGDYIKLLCNKVRYTRRLRLDDMYI